MGFPAGSSDKESAFTDPANAGDMGSILGFGRSPEKEMELTPTVLPV